MGRNFDLDVQAPLRGHAQKFFQCVCPAWYERLLFGRRLDAHALLGFTDKEVVHAFLVRIERIKFAVLFHDDC